ncbi:hypothetical protein PV10_03545 [Exophiala mesophila]|uniref:Uncharacterized protein n=1 Tax=Exophiala mesophila TaxID=212818 RepID=A0A0D1ZMW4_EXOME|nr:uncharacterized protein PV10_03545 [Exophiala mesophila]KIV95957.1 hypothetical protein PV10_03545 [Exophiala mesophila]
MANIVDAHADSRRSPSDADGDLVQSPITSSTPNTPVDAIFDSTHRNNLAFLEHDPYAYNDEDETTFNKNKPILLSSQSEDNKSFMSSKSMKSIRRKLSTLKRIATRRRSKKDQAWTGAQQSPATPDVTGEDWQPMTQPSRAGTFYHGAGIFRPPQRVETYQVSAMAI